MGQLISTTNLSVQTHTLSTPIGQFTGQILNSSLEDQLPSLIRYSKIPYAEFPTGDLRWKKPIALPDDYNYTGEYLIDGGMDYQPSFSYILTDEEKTEFKSPPAGPIKLNLTEEITYLNVFTPLGDAPEQGWPVFFYIHGGLLQNGDPVSFNPIELFKTFNAENDKFVLVIPGYRLNSLGFLSSEYMVEEFGANFGFWDQRMALEWTYENIEYFGGNKEQVTVGGLSAGAYSSFYQMVYELYHETEQQIIKQMVFFSNMVWNVPRPANDSTQFLDLASHLNITGETEQDIFESLLATNASSLVKVQPQLQFTTFRGRLDNDFINGSFIEDISSGVFAEKLASKDIKILMGEINNEGWTYSTMNTPKNSTELADRIAEYYNYDIVDTILEEYEITDDMDELEIRSAFASIIGDGQTRFSGRGFINSLVSNGFPVENIWRYKIRYVNEFDRNYILNEEKYGLIHGQDTNLWFFHETIFNATNGEAEKVKDFITHYVDFLTFKYNTPDFSGLNKTQSKKALKNWAIGWLDTWFGKDNAKTLWRNDRVDYFNYLNATGGLEYIYDEDWETGVSVAEKVYAAQLS